MNNKFGGVAEVGGAAFVGAEFVGANRREKKLTGT